MEGYVKYSSSYVLVMDVDIIMYIYFYTIPSYVLSIVITHHGDEDDYDIVTNIKHQQKVFFFPLFCT